MRYSEMTLGFALIIKASALFAQVEPTTEQRAAHRARMDQLSASISLAEIVGEERVAAARQQAPLLLYNDNTRRLSESSLWVWTQQNRPVAVVAIEHYPGHPMGPRWLFELVSLSDWRLSAERRPELQWNSRDTADAWRTLDGITPAKTEAGRLAQMRQLQQRFSAWESFDKGTRRTTLRPMTAPLLRFNHPESGVIDGAIFAFANGTNPEVLLVFETRSSGNELSTWQYRLGQMTGAKVTVEFDDRVIWERENADPPAERPSYINGWFTAEKTAP